MPRVWIAEPDAAVDVEEFLGANGYPHQGWTEHFLRRALLIRIGTKKETFAWVWFAWLQGNNRVLAMHVCVAREHRLRWITPFVVGRLNAIVEMLDATMVVAYPQRPARFMARFGFEVVGNVAFKFINQEEETDGPVLSAEAEVGAAAV